MKLIDRTQVADYRVAHIFERLEPDAYKTPVEAESNKEGMDWRS